MPCTVQCSFCLSSLIFNLHQKGQWVQQMQRAVFCFYKQKVLWLEVKEKKTPKLFWDDSKAAFTQLTQSNKDCIKVLCEFIIAKTINSDWGSPLSSCFVALRIGFLLATTNPYRHNPDHQTHHINFIGLR